MFSDDDVISRYSDSDAIEDGVLVATSDVDRVTRAVFSWLETKLPDTTEPPTNWPVALSWFDEKDDDTIRAGAAAAGLIEKYAIRAQIVYRNGSILKLYARENKDKIEALEGEANATSSGSVELWILPNEVGGVTLMFPSDY